MKKSVQHALIRFGTVRLNTCFGVLLRQGAGKDHERKFHGEYLKKALLFASSAVDSPQLVI